MGPVKPIEDITVAEWDDTLAVNLRGMFLCCKHTIPVMKKQGGGSIVNIGSLASLTALGRGHIAYSMAMGAVAQMTRELSTEWAVHGVRVNAILCAQVTNPSLAKRMAVEPGLKDKFLSGIPRGRMGKPEDIQGLAVFLASDAAGYVTGTAGKWHLTTNADGTTTLGGAVCPGKACS